MSNPIDPNETFRVGGSLFLVGLGVGWLAGLSVSPVVSVVITSVTGSTAAIIAALSGLKAKEEDSAKHGDTQKPNRQWSVSVIPLLVFVTGIVAGSALGITARNNGVFGSGPSIAVAEWQQAGLVEPDWPRQEIARRLFESQYQPTVVVTGTTTAGASPVTLGSFLFLSVSPDECTKLLAATKLPDATILQNELLALSDQRLSTLPQVITGKGELKDFVEKILCVER